MFPDQHGRLFNDVGSFRSVQLVVVSASERQVRLSCGATLTVVWVRPTTEPGCSQYRLKTAGQQSVAATTFSFKLLDMVSTNRTASFGWQG